MEALEAILTRRSVRHYTARPVPEAAVREVLAAAMQAFSAGNEQAWQLVVITERRLLDAIPRFHPYADMVRQASVAILVCGDLDLEKYKGYWVQDCAAATENLLLAAHARGLGAVWVGVYPKEDRVERMRALLGLPQHVVPMALVPLGYPAERIPPEERYDPARVHRNGW